MTHLISRRAVLTTGLAFTASATHATPAGQRLTLKAFTSQHVSARDIELWLPENPTGTVLPVIYAHDGQNLFDDPARPSRKTWQFNQAVARLSREGVGPAIVVGICASAHRSREYNLGGLIPHIKSPATKAITETCGGDLRSASYLRFIVEELKPYIDQRFKTRPEPAATFMIGASMGGLIALEGVRAYPHVFGSAAALSAHLLMLGPAAGDPSYRLDPAVNPQIMAGLTAYAKRDFPAPDGRCLWIDRGTEELDALYAPFHDAFAAGLTDRGYRTDYDLKLKTYQGSGHHETWWSARLDEPLHYLLTA